MKTAAQTGATPDRRPTTGARRRRLLPGITAGVLAAGVAAILWFAIAQPVKVLPRMEPFPSFVLQDQYGLPLREGDLRGRLVFISFGSARCGEPCAADWAGLRELRERLRAAGMLGSAALLLTISIDPADDNLALQSLAARLGAERGSWRFAHGDPAVVKGLVGGELGIYYGAPDARGQIERDSDLVLIDQSGLIRARYDGAALDLGRVERDLGLLAAESGSSGLMRSVYEASHLFLCYPTD